MSDSLSSSDLADIEKALKESEQESMSVCPEDIFKEIYLPVFSGAIKNDRAVDAWIYMAGGPFKRVRIIDGAGNLLFEVPAWYSTNHMKVEASSNTAVPSFSEVVAQAMMCVNHSPLKATAAFLDATIAHLKNNITKTQDNKLHDEWEKIFARYDITAASIMNNFVQRIQDMKKSATGVTGSDVVISSDPYNQPIDPAVGFTVEE